MREVKKEVLIRNLQKEKDTDWSAVADYFVYWLLAHTDSETFELFRKFLETEGDEWYLEGAEEPGTEVWEGFYDYGSDIEAFADDWVAEEDRENFLQFVEKASGK